MELVALHHKALVTWLRIALPVGSFEFDSFPAHASQNVLCLAVVLKSQCALSARINPFPVAVAQKVSFRWQIFCIDGKNGIMLNLVWYFCEQLCACAATKFEYGFGCRLGAHEIESPTEVALKH